MSGGFNAFLLSFGHNIKTVNFQTIFSFQVDSTVKKNSKYGVKSAIALSFLFLGS